MVGEIGPRRGQPPSGIAIILQTESHALQTPDKDMVTQQAAMGKRNLRKQEYR